MDIRAFGTSELSSGRRVPRADGESNTTAIGGDVQLCRRVEDFSSWKLERWRVLGQSKVGPSEGQNPVATPAVAAAVAFPRES